MRRVIAVFGLALIIVLPAIALAKPMKEKPPKPFQSTEELLKWINSYRTNPEPKRVPEAVKAMSAFGATKEIDQAGVYIGFVAGVLGANRDTADDLIAKMFPLPPEDQVLDRQSDCLLGSSALARHDDEVRRAHAGAQGC